MNPNKILLHEGIESNELRIPALVAPLCTKTFLTDIKNGTCLTFKMCEIKKHRAGQIPPQHILQKLLITELRKNAHLCNEQTAPKLECLLKHLEARKGDKSFLVDMLSRLHDISPVEIFSPNYRYSCNPDRVKPIMTKEELLFYQHLSPKKIAQVVQTATQQTTADERKKKRMGQLNMKIAQCQQELNLMNEQQSSEKV